MLIVLRTLKIKEWIDATKLDDPFLLIQQQENPNGISDFKRINTYRYFTIFWIPIFPIYCNGSFWKDEEGNFYERETIKAKTFLNWLFLFLGNLFLVALVLGGPSLFFMLYSRLTNTSL